MIYTWLIIYHIIHDFKMHHKNKLHLQILDILLTAVISFCYEISCEFKFKDIWETHLTKGLF